MFRTLDLGCGKNPRNPYGALEVFGVDLEQDPERNIVHADLAIEPLPFENEFFGYVTAYDFIEHIPRLVYYSDQRRHPFIELMNEVFRVLKMGDIFLSHTPAFPHAVRLWIPRMSTLLRKAHFHSILRIVTRIHRLPKCMDSGACLQKPVRSGRDLTYIPS